MASQHILIVGAGFAGLGMAIRLKQAGIDDFTILEQSAEVGGTWLANRYPGCACDVQSHLYSFSFEPWPHWTRDFAPQQEILEYLRHCADKHGIRPHIRFRTAATGARFDERTGLWQVGTRGPGGEQKLRARVLVPGWGPLSRPSLPDIPGLGSFEGTTFHSARWDDGVALEGKRVAVIGTGASAIQIVPSIAPRVKELFVYQRTAPWIVPKPDGPIASWKKRVFRRLPIAQTLARRRIYWTRELMALGFVFQPRLLAIAEAMARRHLEKSVADPALRARLAPDYRLGCKRVLPTNDYYPALQRPNVELVTEGIAEVRARSIVTRDGKERPVDAIVLATGFEAAEQIAPFEVRGRSGQVLNDVWREGPEAYLGTAVTDFPNLFLLIGPNTGLGHSSMVFMIESQVAYVLDAIRTMRARSLKMVDVRPDAQARYNTRLQERLKDTIWMSGCKSWYLTRAGKNTSIWPGFTFEFRLRTRRFDERAYELVALSEDDLAARREAEQPRGLGGVGQVGQAQAGE